MWNYWDSLMLLEKVRVYVNGLSLDVGVMFFFAIALVILGIDILNELDYFSIDDGKNFLKNLRFILGDRRDFYEIRLEKNQAYPIRKLIMRLSLLRAEKDSISLFSICITLLVCIFTVPYNEHIFELSFILLGLILIMRFYQKIIIEISIIEDVLKEYSWKKN